MKYRNRPLQTWTFLFIALLAILLLAACSGKEHLLLAELNRQGEAEIFLAQLGEEESTWQSLAEDVTPLRLFAGEYAAFIPDTNRIVLWYADGQDLKVEQMAIGDDAPTEIFKASEETVVFGSLTAKPFTISLTESRALDDLRCYVSLEGAEARRLARNGRCIITENGMVLLDYNRDHLSVTLVSLDGAEETAVLNRVENVIQVRWNEALSTFVYLEQSRRNAQLFLITPGAESGEPLGEKFEFVESFGFLPDGKTVYLIGKLEEDDSEMGLYINGADTALLEDRAIFLAGQSEKGDYVIFLTEAASDEAAYIYHVRNQTISKIVEEDAVSVQGFIAGERFLLRTEDRGDEAILSVSSDGRDTVKLFESDVYTVRFGYLNQATQQLILQLREEDSVEALFVTSLANSDGYFLLEEWFSLTILNASKDHLIFWGREREQDENALFSILLESGAAEVELDDDAGFGFRGLFFSQDGRSLYYTALENGPGNAEVRLVPVDGSAAPERLYRNMLLLDVSWNGEPNLQFIR
jgi:hypothetical protein